MFCSGSSGESTCESLCLEFDVRSTGHCWCIEVASFSWSKLHSHRTKLSTNKRTRIPSDIAYQLVNDTDARRQRKRNETLVKAWTEWTISHT
ncbi:hypothetical protein ACROYT_G010245 [Oculina patagonica]